jgi:hypothetical protein
MAKVVGVVVDGTTTNTSTMHDAASRGKGGLFLKIGHTPPHNEADPTPDATLACNHGLLWSSYHSISQESDLCCNVVALNRSGWIGQSPWDRHVQGPTSKGQVDLPPKIVHRMMAEALLPRPSEQSRQRGVWGPGGFQIVDGGWLARRASSAASTRGGTHIRRQIILATRVYIVVAFNPKDGTRVPPLPQPLVP